MPRSPIAAVPAAGAHAPMLLADLSLWPRAGLKGEGATAWLEARGVLIPEVNQAALQPDGALLLRLSPSEYLGLGGKERIVGTACGLPALSMGGDNEPGLCPVPRDAGTAWFAMAGADLPAMFAKVCGVDLRPRAFGNLSVAQTVVARTTAILVRHDGPGGIRFHAIVDWTMAAYLWGAIMDAMAEFGGTHVAADRIMGAGKG